MLEKALALLKVACIVTAALMYGSWKLIKSVTDYVDRKIDDVFEGWA